jgi:hypothetical protein
MYLNYTMYICTGLIHLFRKLDHLRIISGQCRKISKILGKLQVSLDFFRTAFHWASPLEEPDLPPSWLTSFAPPSPAATGLSMTWTHITSASIRWTLFCSLGYRCEDMFRYSPRIDSNDFAHHRRCHNPRLIQSCSPMPKLALCNKIATQS